MITVFERIPPLFADVYDHEFQAWASEFRARGPKCAIVFNPVPGAAPQFDGEGRLVKAGAWLTAEVDRSQPQNVRVIIRPATPHDEEMIARHTSALSGRILH